jgi:hypothetical protein
MKVEFYNPEMPEGMEVEVGGVLLVNGGDSVEITEEDEAKFLANHGRELKEHFLGNQFMKVGSQKGKVVYLDQEDVVEDFEPHPELSDEPTTESPEKEGE